MNIPARHKPECAHFGRSARPEMGLIFPRFVAVVLLLSAFSLETVSAQTAPPLGTAQKFAALGASTVTNTGGTVVNGDLGVSPGSAFTGFPPGIVTGTIHAADGVAAQGQTDALAAYNFLSAEACTTNLTGTDLGGLTLQPGVYCFNSSAQLTGILTLDSTLNPNGIFVFKIGSTLTTASNASMIVLGGSACNVYFQVGSSATLGTGTQFLGSIFASASITANTGSVITGSTYALNGAVTFDTIALTACMGTIKVCKVAGSGVTLGTNIDFNVAGTALSIAAGPSPAGTCAPVVTVPAHPTTITETIPLGTTLSSVSTLPGAGLLISSNLAAGTAIVNVTPGGQTTATFIDTIPPIIPTTGFLQICKIAGSGVTLGAPFTFQVAGTNVIVAAGAAPLGTCGTPLELPAGGALITEVLPAGTTLTNVSTLPTAGLLVSSNLAAGTATVTIVAGSQTIATFTDTIVPTTGFLRVCKVAGSGISLGMNFTFNAAGNTVVVPAGVAPLGSCSPQIELPAGSAVVTETIGAGTLLASISTLPPAALVTSNLGAGSATVTITAGAVTTVTYTNTIPPVLTTGFIQVCKVAGAGIAEGTPFTFNVGGTSVTVPAGPAPGGTCSPALVAPVGITLITETIPSGTSLTSVSTLPADALVASNLAAGTANVSVIGGGQTVATFINTIIPVVPTTGFIQVCKIAGAGIAVGTNFTFNVGGTTVTVPAGPAPLGTCSTVLTVTAGPIPITETIPSGTVLTSVSTLPDGLLVSSNLSAGTATVTVNAGFQTIATFLDTLIPIVPSTGFIQVCKVAGAGVAVGTNFTFNVGGTQVIVAAGPAPGGTCSAALTVPAGATVVTETLPVGTTLTSVSTLPVGLLVSSNLVAGTATVTVNAGSQTIATFLDTVIPPTGFLQVCKTAGTGVAVGTNFVFNVGGTSVTVAAGSCSAVLPMPIGATVITETLPTGTTLTSVATVPAGALVSSDLSAGTATVNVNAGAQTTATFLNTVIPVTGTLQVCKAAGTGVAVGTNFAFNVGGTPVTVAAGSCSPILTVAPGPKVITETLPAGNTLTSVTVAPAGLLVSSNLAAGTATVTVTAGVQTTATFLNTFISLTGTLQVCKAAGTGVAVGTNFVFNVGGTPVTVAAGSCSPILTVAPGARVITETLPAGTTLTSVTTAPAGALVSINLAVGTSTVMVTAGAQTTATFLNTVIPTTGILQICKIAGTGVVLGTNFTFTIGGTSVTVPAGVAPGGSCSPVLVVPLGATVIRETLPANTTLTSVTTSPAGALASSNLPTGTVTVTVGTSLTVAAFTNTSSELGMLKVCKIAGTGVTSGVNFRFSVGGASLTVPAGYCAKGSMFPLGTVVTITEIASPGTAVSAISVLPVDRQGTPNVPGRTITATIGVGVTEAYFTNVATP